MKLSTRLLAALLIVFSMAGVGKGRAPTNDELDTRLRAVEVKLQITTPATQPATQPATVPTIPPVITPTIPDPSGSLTRVPLSPKITASNKVYTAWQNISVNKGVVWDGGGATYTGRISVNGGTAQNFKLNTRGNTAGGGDVLAINSGTARDFEILAGGYDGVRVTGKSTIQRAIIRTVNQYPLFLNGSAGFVVEDVAILGGSESQSVTRWGDSWGTFRHLYIRATQGKALSRGDSIMPGVVYESCDIEGTMAHAPQNPLGENNGGQGRAVFEFQLPAGLWVADGATWEPARKAVQAAVARGVTDRCLLARAALSVALRGGTPCPATDADIAVTLAQRDELIRHTGFATHKNTRVAALCLSPEAGGVSVYEGDCELKLTSLFGELKTGYPRPGWGEPGDPARPFPSFVLRCPVTTVSGYGTDAATAAKLLIGSVFQLNGKAVRF